MLLRSGKFPRKHTETNVLLMSNAHVTTNEYNSFPTTRSFSRKNLSVVFGLKHDLFILIYLRSARFILQTGSGSHLMVRLNHIYRSIHIVGQRRYEISSK